MKLTFMEIFTTLFMVLIIVLYISILVNYGDKPVSEMPIWVWWLLKGGN